MSGFEMMLKSFGLDPAAIKQSLETFMGVMKSISDDLKTIKQEQSEQRELIAQLAATQKERDNDRVN
jgi:peptidoglycan hydrolase CwlO-like protein